MREVIDAQEFVDVVKEIQEDSMLSSVRLVAAMEEFKQYKRTGIITLEQFRSSFKKLIETQYTSENQKLKIDKVCKRLVKIFDTNKNGRLEYQEVVCALCVFCKGSVQQKLKWQLSIFTDSSAIKAKELKPFFESVLHLALSSTPEVLLDYPVHKLA